MTRETVTLRHVGRPKLRLPTSEKTWAVIFLSFVHRTTSHGAWGVSVPSDAPSASCRNTMLLEIDDWRECGDRKAGEWPRGEASGEGDSRDEKRRSNGCRGVVRCGRREPSDAGTLLPGEDNLEP